MAFVSVAGGGTGVIAGASASSFTITTTAAVDLSASRFCLVPVSSDNISTSDGATNDHSSVTGGTGTWTKIGEYTNSNGAAAAGVTTSLWLFLPSGANASGTVFTVTLSSAVVDACAQTRIFSWDSTKGIRQTTEAAVVGNGVDASNDFGSVAFSGLTSLARLYFRALGKEANSTTNVTASTNFAAGTAIRSRNNAAAVLSRTEWRINTSTGETSNPTLAVSGDTAAIFAALEEYTLGGGGDIAGSSDTAFTTAGNLTGSGALSGSSAPTFTTAATLIGLAPVTGAVTVAFTTAATGQATAAASGSATVVFATAGAITGAGRLSGAIAPTFTATASLAGSGALAGSSAGTFTTAGNIAGSGALSGAVSVAFDASGNLAGSGALGGSADAAFALSGALSGLAAGGAITGSVSLGLSVSGQISSKFSVWRAARGVSSGQFQRDAVSHGVRRGATGSRNNRGPVSRR